MTKKRKILPFSKDDFEEVFYEALQSQGWIIPKTVNEVKRAEELGIEKDFSDLPRELQDPRSILHRNGEFRLRIKKAQDFPPDTWQEPEAIFRRAAREGKKITPEVEAKMKKDRDEAENVLESSEYETE